MSVYLYRLIPPRPSFPADITPEEGAAMERHFGYWTEQIRRGAALVYGPVPDPKGTYGMAVLTVADEAQAQAICANDPAIAANVGFRFEVFAMPHAVVNQGATGAA